MSETEQKSEIDWNVFEQNMSKFVKFVAGKPKKLKITSAVQSESEIKDKSTNELKIVPSLKMAVVEEDGEAVEKELSVTSKKLALALKPFIDKGFPFVVEITQFGTGFQIEWNVK